MEMDYPLFMTCWRCVICGAQVAEEDELLCANCHKTTPESTKKRLKKIFWGQPEEMENDRRQS